MVRKIWNGHANLAELTTDAASGHLQVLSLRLYDPRSLQWSLNTANANSGSLGVPTIGDFKNGRGEFFDQESFNGRTILVRNVWSDITADSCRFEQAFSDDGGKTWEVNWIAVDIRVKCCKRRGGCFSGRLRGAGLARQSAACAAQAELERLARL